MSYDDKKQDESFEIKEMNLFDATTTNQTARKTIKPWIKKKMGRTPATDTWTNRQTFTYRPYWYRFNPLEWELAKIPKQQYNFIYGCVFWGKKWHERIESNCTSVDNARTLSIRKEIIIMECKETGSKCGWWHNDSRRTKRRNNRNVYIQAYRQCNKCEWVEVNSTNERTNVRNERFWWAFSTFAFFFHFHRFQLLRTFFVSLFSFFHSFFSFFSSSFSLQELRPQFY